MLAIIVHFFVYRCIGQNVLCVGNVYTGGRYYFGLRFQIYLCDTAETWWRLDHRPPVRSLHVLYDCELLRRPPTRVGGRLVRSQLCWKYAANCAPSRCALSGRQGAPRVRGGRLCLASRSSSPNPLSRRTTVRAAAGRWRHRHAAVRRRSADWRL